MAEFLLPDLVIDKKAPEKSSKDFIKIIKPDWKDEDFTIKPLRGGYSNLIYVCCNTNRKETIMIRLRTTTEHTTFIQFASYVELTLIQELSTTGHFSKVIAIFANGYAYEYIPGRAIFSDEPGTMTDEILKLFVNEFVYIHSIKLKGVDYTTDQSFDRIDQILVRSPFLLEHESVPPKDTLIKEVEFVKEYLKSVDCDLTICHGDPHPGNVVWNEDQGKVTFVDWEGVYVGSRYVDIARFYILMEIFENLSQLSDEQFPENWALKFPKLYFDEWNKQLGKKFDDQEFCQFQSDVKKCKLGLYLIFLILSICFPHVCKSFAGDSFVCYDFCLKGYFTLKEDLLKSRKFEASQ